MEYTIKLPDIHALAILQILEQVPLPMAQALPIYQGIKAQVLEQKQAQGNSAVQPVQSPPNNTAQHDTLADVSD